jgi:hypothetical protein
MKHLLTIVFFVALYIGSNQYQCYAQTDAQKKFFDDKINKYTKMKNTGWVLAGTGGAFMLVGLSMVATADWETNTTPTSSTANTNDSNGIVGVLLLAAGVPVFITGVVIGSVGSKRVKHYKKGLNDISFQVKPHVNGIGLVCNF